MSEPSTCPTCGSTMAMSGTCPQCMLRLCMAQEGAATPAVREAPGTEIGRYRLIEEIGEGGFGIVYLAEQEAPVRRKVALKVLKPGMDTREVVARFKIERQTLALMDHPHIAQVYDGGATESGRPYFVMELVDGIPITRYCSKHQLGIRERLKLFMDVIAAVQHAHQKGVIHRDLKPSNILVSTLEGRPVVKVIDFGVAKAVAMNLSETAVMTALGRMIGTPEYMSPEQADLSAVDVDTRSDIYSLGVVLYELLTGATPMDPAVLRKVGFAEMLRMIREEKPPRPSLRNADLRGARDLDWVVMQALEKDPALRYQSAIGLHSDIRRFLDDEPVSASPPSASYRLRKFVKRHRFGVMWSCVFLTVVVGATIGMTMLYFDAQHQAHLAMRRTWEARVSQAAALRWGGQPERRFLAFEALREAAAINWGRDSPENLNRLRDSAIASLAIVDMRRHESWPGNAGYTELVAADGKLTRYATTMPDGRISIHAYPGHRLIRELPGHGAGVNGMLRFSPDGRRLAVGYGQRDQWRLSFWNPDEESPAMDAGEGVESALAFSPDGTRCYVARPSGGIDVLDAANAALLRHVAAQGRILALDVSASGGWIAAAHEDRIEIHDLQQDHPVASINQQVRTLAWSGCGDSLAAGGADGQVWLWHDGDWSAPAYRIAGHAGAVDALTWSPDSRLLVSQGADGVIRFWDPYQGAELGWHPGRAAELRFSADGRRLGVLREGRLLTVMEFEPGNVCDRGRKHLGQAGVTGGAWNDQGTLAATTGDDGVRLWNRSGLQLAMLPLPKARGVAFAGDTLLVAAQDGLRGWRISERQVDGGLELTLADPVMIGDFHDCQQISVSRDHASLVMAACKAGSERPAVWWLDLGGGQEPRAFESSEPVAFCALSPDKRWIAAGTRRGDGVRVWATQGHAPPVDLPNHGPTVVAFSPDGSWLVTGNTEAYRFWEPGSWQLKREIPSEMGGGSGQMAYSPRMTAFVIACRRAELKVLHPITLQQISAPDFDRESPLCFDPHGRIMVTTGQTGGLFFWKLDEVRAGLVQIGLDWQHMTPFPPLELPKVVRIHLPRSR